MGLQGISALKDGGGQGGIGERGRGPSTESNPARALLPQWREWASEGRSA